MIRNHTMFYYFITAPFFGYLQSYLQIPHVNMMSSYSLLNACNIFKHANHLSYYPPAYCGKYVVYILQGATWQPIKQVFMVNSDKVYKISCFNYFIQYYYVYVHVLSIVVGHALCAFVVEDDIY